MRIEIVGPSEIAAGESVQLTANAIKTDGSVENVTTQTGWSTNSSAILQVNISGLATGKTNGETFVNARFGQRFASRRILVLPSGTFRLSGTVKESGFGIDGASVTVISGIGEGLTVQSGFGGFYALYGVKGVVRIHTKKDGYQNTLQQLDVTAHGTQDVEIVAVRERADFKGVYTLTILAGAQCSSLPADARRREYVANVAQDGARLTVTLGNADFIVTNGRGRGFTGFVEVSNEIRFSVGDAFYYYYYYGGPFFDIVERIGDLTVLIAGTARTTATPGRIAGTLSGSIVTSAKSAAPFTPFSAQCHGNHGFEMLRR